MKVLGISREEAEQLWEDDNSDEVLPEVAEMEAKAKDLKRHYEKSEKVRKPSTKERKVDTEKKFLLDLIVQSINDTVKIEEVKTETEISFQYNSTEYSIKLTKHRPKK